MRDAETQALLDKQAIHEVLMRYCRGVDRLDEALIRSCYHQGAWDEHGPFQGDAWEFASYCVRELGAAFTITQHHIANELVELDGDRASCESYFTAYHRNEKDGQVKLLVVGGRYLDRFERRSGEWKIARRVTVLDWARVDPLEREWRGAAAYARGGRGALDPLAHI
jgi:hypothetical protein